MNHGPFIVGRRLTFSTFHHFFNDVVPNNRVLQSVCEIRKGTDMPCLSLEVARLNDISTQSSYGTSAPLATLISSPLSLSGASVRRLSAVGRFSAIQSFDTIDTWAPVSDNASVGHRLCQTSFPNQFGNFSMLNWC